MKIAASVYTCLDLTGMSGPVLQKTYAKKSLLFFLRSQKAMRYWLSWRVPVEWSTATGLPQVNCNASKMPGFL